jgi:signal transduction histidine kinase/ActR/RegA family two-component response regulator
MSFNPRTIALLVLCGTIPLLLAAAVFGYFYIAEKKEALDGDLRQHATALSVGIARELGSQKALLALATDSPRFDPPIKRRAFEELAQRFRTRLPAWEMIHLADTDGKILLSVPRATENSPSSPRDVLSFQQAVASTKPIVGSVFRTTRDMVTFPVRMLIQRKNLSYVLSILVRPDLVGNLLFQEHLPPSWSAWVIDGNGNLVAATKAAPSSIGLPGSAFFSSSQSFPGGMSEGALGDSEPVRVVALPIEGTDWSLYLGMPVEMHQQAGLGWFRFLVLAVSLVVVLSVATALLLHRELLARRRQAESLAAMQRMDALGKLTGGVAHDFNNLLMVFQGAMEGLKRRRHDDVKFDVTMNMLAEGIGRGKAITQRLLSFSSRSNQNAQTIFLPECAEALEQLVKQAVTDRVVVHFDVAEDLWPVTVDQQGLEVALINLATNAKEAMPQGGKLVVLVRNCDAGSDGSCVLLTVTDDGIGIASDHLERVFEPFFTTKGVKSNGLGLSQVYGFAQRNRGRVQVNSIEGQGASFTIYLPKAVSAVARTVQPSDAQGVLPSRILVVDDTPASLDACRLALEIEGVQVLTATDGAEALKAIKSDPSIRYVLSDIMMPNMDGLELSERLCANHPDVAVVLMTGYSDALEAGFRTDRAVLGKPFEAKELAVAFSKGSKTSGNVVALRPNA